MLNKKSWFDEAVARITARPEYAGKTILKNALPNKMSETLLDFAKPLLDEIDMSDRLALDSALRMAVTVWNYSVLKDKPSQSIVSRKERDSLEPMITKTFGGAIGESVLKTLLNRKETLYPDNLHGITDFEVKWNADGSAFNLTVIATG